ncbi:hypothetical protein DH2020_006504 [Rehmannia glutinosa]|uniref:Zinc metallopeptidase EGY3, chloroplastic n=1 Tax=Rehmannia glutinosa TaxID=99300 RepID=A0ABR0XJ25_REHGL
MATAIFTSFPCPSSSRALDKNPLHTSSLSSNSSFSRNPFGQKAKFSCKRLNFCVKAENTNEPSSSPSSLTVEVEKNDVNEKKDLDIGNGLSGSEDEDKDVESDEEKEKEKMQELDWKTDEEFKNFMGNPSIEAAIKLEKKRADRKLKQLDRERSDNPLIGFINNLVRDNLSREKGRLEKAEEAFKALDLNKLKSCFGFDSFFATDVRRFGDGGIFIGNLRRPIEEVIPKLEKKLSEAAGREVVVWFMEEKTDEITKQVFEHLLILVLYAVTFSIENYEMDEVISFILPLRYDVVISGTSKPYLALACVVQPKSEMDLQFESTKLMASSSSPNATIDDYLSDVAPLFGGFLTILAVSEIATRVTAARYGVKLTSAYLTSLVLTIAAFVADGSFNGGDNALYIRPQFFYNNPLLSFIQYVVGPYTDDLGNVLPYAVEGVGVPVDPLAFAGLLGMVVTSLNLLPCGRLEGGRIAQAMFGRSTATLLSFATSLLLGIGGLSGSVLCLAWGLFATFFRGGEEIPAKDEISPLGDDRFAWGCVLFLICFLTLFPNGGGTFSSSFFGSPFFRGDL